MSKPRAPLPTLTEVIEVQSGLQPLDTGPAPLPPDSVPMESAPEVPADAATAIAAEVVELLQPRIDAILEARIRETIAPLASRLAEETYPRLREELSGEVWALVARAVSEALAHRHRR
jgi:hypothetical protein